MQLVPLPIRWPSEISDGDGHLDIAVTTSTVGMVSVLLGNGDGTFQEAHNYAVGSLPSSLVVSDLNGDGHFDLAVLSVGTISALLGNGDGTFRLPQVTSLEPYQGQW